jgi:response regulator RpfG family c-di-GMP phosphodiesterase
MPEESQKPTVLIVEDELGPRNALKVILRPFYNLRAVDTGHEAIRALKEGQVDIVTLDMKLPDRQGIDLLQEIKAERGDVEVIIITGYGSLKSAMDAIRYGAAAYLLKPFNVTELLAVINQTAGKKQRLIELRELLKHLEPLWGTEQEIAAFWKQLRDQYPIASPRVRSDIRSAERAELLTLLSDLLEAKSRDLFTHSCRTSFYAGLVGKHMNLSENEQRALTIGAFLHDVGQIGLPDDLIQKRKTVALPEKDAELFRRHPEMGARVVSPLGLSAEIGQVILYHHERFDASGYPYGLRAEGIPKFARIVAICEVFDHLTSEQLTPAPLTTREALDHMRRRAGTDFDPVLIDVLARVAAECATSLPDLAASSRPTVISEL